MQNKKISFRNEKKKKGKMMKNEKKKKIRYIICARCGAYDQPLSKWGRIHTKTVWQKSPAVVRILQTFVCILHKLTNSARARTRTLARARSNHVTLSSGGCKCEVEMNEMRDK